jgi:hypothetical protein
MAKHAKEVEKRRRRAVRPGVEMPEWYSGG